MTFVNSHECVSLPEEIVVVRDDGAEKTEYQFRNYRPVALS